MIMQPSGLCARRRLLTLLLRLSLSKSIPHRALGSQTNSRADLLPVPAGCWAKDKERSDRLTLESSAQWSGMANFPTY